MNVIPNAYISVAKATSSTTVTPTLIPTVTTAEMSANTAPAAVATNQIIIPSPTPSGMLTTQSLEPGLVNPSTTNPIPKCAICHRSDLNAPYQLLSVRPMVAAPAEHPFFPVLETPDGPACVPACQACAVQLLSQWEDFERKKVPIANRKYDLGSIAALASKVVLAAPSPSGIVVATPATNRPINLTTTNGKNGRVGSISLLNTATVVKAATLQPPTSESDSSKPLDLSCSGKSNVITAQPSSVRLFATGPNGKPILLNLPPGTTLRKASDGTNMVATSTPLFFSTSAAANSSMTNLIKVATSATAIVSPAGGGGEITPPASTTRRPVCGLCEEPTAQLLQVALKPLGNCPYFPTLSVKSGLMDSMGKIGTCESCHRQLIQQWDAFQKQNKPINERHYQIQVTSKPTSSNVVLSPGVVVSGLVPGSSAGKITISAQSMSQLAPFKQLFVCGLCTRDLLVNACTGGHNTHLAYAMMTEKQEGVITTSTGKPGTLKKLLLQTAVEVNLLPFVATPLTAPMLQQLQTMSDLGKVFLCADCFDKMRLVKITPQTGNEVLVTKIAHSVNGATAATAAAAAGSVNGTGLAIPTTSLINTVTTTTRPADKTAASPLTTPFDSSDLCQACGHNKADRLVETKETTGANGKVTPFFSFLASAADQLGRARICSACNLTLEMQWDGYESEFVPYHLRSFRLATPVLTAVGKRLPILANASAGASTSGANGGGTLVVLPNNGAGHVFMKAANEQQQQHLLLTTVNSARNVVDKISVPVSAQVLNAAAAAAATASTSSSITPTGQQQQQLVDERAYRLADEFLAFLGGPQQMLSGQCAVCNESSPAGSTYSVYSSPQSFLLSKELGLYPYFPFLAVKHPSTKKATAGKNAEIVHLACVFCYHSLIAQWAAYNLSVAPEDRDPGNRIYNCNEYYCYVCGVATYRAHCKTIKTKDFAFLAEHKRPPGALTLCKGEKVVACVNCFETLTHQLLENERMKVPLEMRKYNWMAMPQTPPQTNATDPKVKIEPQQQHQDLSSVKLVPTSTVSHNGLPGALYHLKPTMVTVTSTANNSNSTNQQILTHLVPTNMPQQQQQATINSSSQQATPSYLAPSYTLEPLVAAAMAARPVSTANATAAGSVRSITLPASAAATTAAAAGSPLVTVVDTSKTIYTDVLRDLAKKSKHDTALRQQQQQNVPNHTVVLNHHHQATNSINNTNNHHSFNLSTLADVAAHVENHRNGQQQQQQQLLLTTIPASNASGQMIAQRPAQQQQAFLLKNGQIMLQTTNPLLEKDIQQQFLLQQQQQQLTNGVLNGEVKTYSTRQQSRKRNATVAQIVNGVNKSNKRQITEQMHNDAAGPSGVGRYHNKQANTKRGQMATGAAGGQHKPKVEVKQEQIEKRPPSPYVPFYDRSPMSKLEFDCKWMEEQKKARFQQLKLLNQAVNQTIDSEGDQQAHNTSGQDKVLKDMVDEEFSECFTVPPSPEPTESILPFLDSVSVPAHLKDTKIPTPEEQATADADPKYREKMNFLSTVGILTRQDYFEALAAIHRQKLRNSKLSQMSLELPDPINELLMPDLNLIGTPCIDPSPFRPDDPRLEEKQFDTQAGLDKKTFLETIGLIPADNIERVLKVEFNWMTVLEDRRARKAMYGPVGCYAKIYNNIEEKIYKEWFDDLLEKGEKGAPHLVERYKKYVANRELIREKQLSQPPIAEVKEEDESQEDYAGDDQMDSAEFEDNHHEQQSEQQQQGQQLNLTQPRLAMVNGLDAGGNKAKDATVPNGALGLAVNMKPFSAQDFHNEVFLKTQLAEMSRAMTSNEPIGQVLVANNSMTNGTHPQVFAESLVLTQPSTTSVAIPSTSAGAGEQLTSNDKDILREEAGRLRQHLMNNSIEKQKLLKELEEIQMKVQRIEEENAQLQANMDRLVEYI